MAVVRTCAIVEISPHTKYRKVLSIKKSCPFRDPYSRAVKDYDGLIEVGMFYNFEKDAFAHTREELENLK